MFICGYEAALIARCLAHHDYSPVHIPTEQDDQLTALFSRYLFLYASIYF